MKTMTIEETMREYTSTRMKMYIDKAKKGKWKTGEEEKLYDNIMELISMHDYCYVGLVVIERQQLDDVKSHHEWKTQINKLKGMVM